MDRGDLHEKLEALRVRLNSWSKSKKIARKKAHDDLYLKLDRLKAEEPDEDVLAKLTEVKLALNLEADKEELYWEKRTRANWLKNTDRNTSFFHRYATYRRKRNPVNKLMNDGGEWVKGDQELMVLATSFFRNLFSTEPGQNCSSPRGIIQPCITEEINVKLCKAFEEKEVVEALKGMSPFKASGEDNFPAFFFQKF